MNEPTLLLSPAEIEARVEVLAAGIAPRIDDERVAVCLLTGGLWFCADLTRALSRRGREPWPAVPFAIKVARLGTFSVAVISTNRTFPFVADT